MSPYTAPIESDRWSQRDTLATGHGHCRDNRRQHTAEVELSFPDDLVFEEWLARLDTLTDAHNRLEHGEQVSGPAVDTYRNRVTASTRFAGRVLRHSRDAAAMLANLNLQIFPGKGMTCVLDPAKAACRLAGDDHGTRRTPDITDCRPACANIARTDRDIDHLRSQVAQLQDTVDDLSPHPSDTPANNTNSPASTRSSPTTNTETAMASDHTAERDAIRAAMHRLLTGQPVNSTGALTVLQLAAEAGVKR